MAHYLTLFFFALFVSAGIRSIIILQYRRVFRGGFSGDASVHYSIVKHLKTNGSGAYIEQFLIRPEPMSYPLGFHKIAQLFPLIVIRKYEWLPNLIIFSVFSALYFIVIRYIGQSADIRINNSVLIYCAVFYYFSIANLVFKGPSIAYIKLSERLLGKMSCSFYFLLLFTGLYWHNRYLLIFSVLFCALALLSSIFARQAIFFTSLLLSIYYIDPTPVLCAAGGTGVAVLLSGKYFLRGLKHTLLQWSIYKTHTKKSEIVNRNLNKFIRISELSKLASRSKGSNRLLKMAAYSISKEPVKLLTYNPEFFLLIALLSLTNSPFDSFRLFGPIIATLIVYLITTTSSFNHLGESYRYIEYNLYFIMPFFLSILSSQHRLNELFISHLLPYFLYTLLFFYVFYKVYVQHYKWPAYDSLTAFLNTLSIKPTAVIFPISMRIGADICSRSECKSFWWQPGIISKDIYDEFIKEYPYLKSNWKDLFRKYKVTHVIGSKATLKEIENLDWRYDFAGLQLTNEDDQYFAYTVPKGYY